MIVLHTALWVSGSGTDGCEIQADGDFREAGVRSRYGIEYLGEVMYYLRMVVICYLIADLVHTFYNHHLRTFSRTSVMPFTPANGV